jgi:hypothetical protein
MGFGEGCYYPDVIMSELPMSELADGASKQDFKNGAKALRLLAFYPLAEANGNGYCLVSFFCRLL